MDNILYKGEVTVKKYTDTGKYRGYQQFHNLGTSKLFTLICNLLAANKDKSIGVPKYLDIVAFKAEVNDSSIPEVKESYLKSRVPKNKTTIANGSITFTFTYNYYDFANPNLTNTSLYAALYDEEKEGNILAWVNIGNDYIIGENESHILNWELTFTNGNSNP